MDHGSPAVPRRGILSQEEMDMTGKPAFYKSNDFIIGSVFLSFSALTLLEIQKIKNPEGRYIPVLAALLIGLASVSLIIKALTGKSGSASNKLFYNSKEIIMIASLLLFYFSMRTIGFYTTSLLYLHICNNEV